MNLIESELLTSITIDKMTLLCPESKENYELKKRTAELLGEDETSRKTQNKDGGICSKNYSNLVVVDCLLWIFDYYVVCF